LAGQSVATLKLEISMSPPYKQQTTEEIGIETERERERERERDNKGENNGEREIARKQERKQG